MSLTGMLITFTAKQSAKRFEAASKDPARVQNEKLMNMVQKNADTEYGRRHGFASIRTVKEYQHQVPVVTYEDIRNDMERVTKGAKGVFTAEEQSGGLRHAGLQPLPGSHGGPR